MPPQQLPPTPQHTPGPQPPYHPPMHAVNTAPQQHENGQYEVVPPPANPNARSTGHNPYEFIVAPNSPKAGRMGTDKSFWVRIGVVLGGIVLLLIIGAIVLSALGPKGNTAGLTSIAERQQEIVRIATAVATNANGQDTKNFAANTAASLTTSQQQVVNYLGTQGTKLDPKVLALDKSSQTDTLLGNAASANTYDSTAVQTLTSQLQTYQSLLSNTYKDSTGAKAKAMLQTCNAAAVKLLQQAQSLQQQ